MWYTPYDHWVNVSRNGTKIAFLLSEVSRFEEKFQSLVVNENNKSG